MRRRQYPPPPEDAQTFATMETKKPLHEYGCRAFFYCFSWMRPVIRLIKHQGALYPRDLYVLPSDLRVERATEWFRTKWNKSMRRKIRRHRSTNCAPPNVLSISLFGNMRYLLPIMFLVPIQAFLGQVPTIVINKLIPILSIETSDGLGGENPNVFTTIGALFQKSLPWILLIGVAQLLLAFFINISLIQGCRIMCVSGQAITSLVYEKLLSLSEMSRSSSVSGSVVNLVFTDTSKVSEFAVFTSMFLSLPFRIIYSFVIVCTTVDPLSLVGISAILLTFPISTLLIRRQLTYTKQYMCYKDIRMKKCTEVLTGIKLVKYLGLEQAQILRLEAARSHELQYLIKEKNISAYMFALFASAGPLMLTLTFVTLALCSKFDDVTAYSTMLAFNGLAFAFMQLPQLFTRLFEALISSNRIAAFLQLPSKDGTNFSLQLPGDLVQATAAKASKNDDDNDNVGLLSDSESVEMTPDLSPDVAICTVGTPSYSWGSEKYLSLPMILDPLFKPTSDAIKRFRRMLPSLKHEHRVASQRLLRVTPSPIPSDELETLCDAVSLSCPYLDQWAQLCDLPSLTLLDQISAYKEICYLPTSADTPLQAAQRAYLHVATAMHFIDDPRFAPYRIGFRKARDMMIHKDACPPILQNLTFSIPKGNLVGIHGTVGAGKTSLLLAMLGELANISTDPSARILSQGTIAYCAQIPYIMSGTIKSNVLFFNEYDEARFTRAIQLSCLEGDLELFADGVETEIGERGITLSGGQKARVALARAIYADSDIYLLDDPLSAVDAHVGKTLWADAICSYLIRERKKTVVIVSHHVHFFADCDLIFEVTNGILERVNHDAMNARGLISVSTSSHDLAASSHMTLARSKDILAKKSQKPVHIVDDEKQSDIGTVGWKTYREWFRMCGRNRIVGYIMISIVGNLLQQYLSLLITHWTNNAYGIPDYWYIGIYIAISAIYTLFVFLGRILYNYSSIAAARLAHTRMANAVLHTRLLFFETNPMGRILNRFSRDIDRCDTSVPNSLSPVIDDFVFLTINNIVISILSWPFIIALIIILIAYISIFLSFRIVSPQLSRLSSVLSSPVFALIQDSLSALPTIRSYRKEVDLMEVNMKNLTRSYSAEWLKRVMFRWLSFRGNTLMAVFVVALSICAVIIAPIGDGAKYVGMLLSNGYALNTKLVVFVFSMSSLEGAMNSVERLSEYCNLPSEEKELPPHEQDVEEEEVGLKVHNLSLRYRPELDLVLHDVTFEIKRGERVGIIGRTGAGKSSLTTAIFRLCEPEDGAKIIVGKTDLLQIPINEARAHVAIIPQDPFLFSGTLRTCLCTYSQMQADGMSGQMLKCYTRHSDEKLWRVLEQVQMREYFEKQPGGLDAKIAANGDNLSAGQRQLVCVARALLSDAPLVILDEATAQVDGESDAIIQKTIRTSLCDRTILAIAHRLDTIVDFDRIIVMNAGRVSEFDTPRALLERPESIFASLISECKNADALREKIITRGAGV
ncbi:MRP-like ABC transporter [Giardia muris]|uniref:MRP-like ABC transporter n=1 Tax=Giardia muris TaxID=5742 RepID=A0A4Z1SXT0_GIAMU|nr:MRP-like ABC transporter [Giardia muris]|eukprot:TNJ28328.1 MRP-like ABC transporter [Giardia muris]